MVFQGRSDDRVLSAKSEFDRLEGFAEHGNISECRLVVQN